MATMMIDGYVAEFDYDPEEKSFHGHIANIPEVVTFWGESAEEIEREARASLEVYLDVCQEQGIQPSKPYSGKFQVRMNPEQHRAVATAAALSGKTLNAWVITALDREAREQAGEE
jgi:predicted HicB family RNase H-like nuclease